MRLLLPVAGLLLLSSLEAQAPRPVQLPLPPGAHPDATLARLFTPLRPPRGHYAVYVTAESLDRCLTHFRRLAPDDDPRAETWQARRLDPLSGFGKSGLYPRSRLARLFGGKSVTVARGSIRADGRFLASITLFSPHPDAAFTRLEPGTMIIVFTLEEGGLRD